MSHISTDNIFSDSIRTGFMQFLHLSNALIIHIGVLLVFQILKGFQYGYMALSNDILFLEHISTNNIV